MPLKRLGENSGLVKFNSLFDETFGLELDDAQRGSALGYMARAMVQATIPHKNVTATEFVRTNGAFSMSIQAPASVGLPYGSIPRLLMAWVTTEAVRTKTPVLELGPSLSHFMRQLDLIPTGGRWGSIPRLKNQMQRLFASTISLSYNTQKAHVGMGLRVAKEYILWWDPKRPDQATLWMSTVTLSRDFFDEIVNSPVPINMNALRHLKRSPFALDIYTWLTYRMSYLRQPTVIPWETLQTQFGADYHLTRQFKAFFLKHLRSVLTVYRNARVTEATGGIELHPSPTHAKRLN
jgi:hypothetical protein